MTVPQNVIAYAKKELGYGEYPSGSNNCKFNTWYGGNGYPWCATFVSYCFFMAGLPLPASTPKGFSYCPAGVDWFRKKNAYHTTPVVGDVVFFDWYKGTGKSGAYHVGIVSAVNNDGTILAIEGNTSNVSQDNGGQVMEKKRSPVNYHGFGRPVYSGSTPVLTQPVILAPVEGYPEWDGTYYYLTSPNMNRDKLKQWKLRMKQRGWNIDTEPLSVYGEFCAKVVKDFQLEKGLEADGVLGPLTWKMAWEAPIT